MAIKRYLVVVKHEPNKLRAFVPDQDGIVATGDALQEIEVAIKEGFTLYYDLDRGGPHPGQTIPH